MTDHARIDALLLAKDSCAMARLVGWWVGWWCCFLISKVNVTQESGFAKETEAHSSLHRKG